MGAPAPQTVGVHPTPGAKVRDAEGPAILLAAHPRLAQQATETVEKVLHVFVFPETEKDSKSLQRHI